MKRFLQLSLIIPLFLFAQQKNVAVLQFDADNISESEVRILTNRLNTEIFNIGKFVVIERSQMEEIMKEQGLQQSGCVSSECAVEVGKLLGVDAMITGSMGRLGSLYTISARMIDVESGRILNTVSKDVSGSIDILLTKTMTEIAAELSGTQIAVTVNLIKSPKEMFLYLDNKLLSRETEQLELTYGEYSFSSLYPKYESFYTDLKIDSASSIDLKLELILKSKKKALVRSILFPGLGQQYYESKTKATIFSITAFGICALLANTYSKHHNEDSLVNQYYDDYRNATVYQDEIEQNWNKYQNQIHKVNDLNNQLLLYSTMLGVTWFINVVDAFLFNGLSSD